MIGGSNYFGLILVEGRRADDARSESVDLNFKRWTRRNALA